MVATPALAKQYVCQLAEANFISTVVVIDHNESTGQVTVFDGVIKHYIGNEISGEVSLRNTKRITFTWVLDGINVRTPGRNQYVSGFNYRMTIQHSSLSARITARPNGYTDRFSSKGRCEIK